MRLSHLEQTAIHLWSQLDTPVSRELRKRALSGDWVGVLSYKIDPTGYTDSETYLKDAQAVAFLKKNPYVKGSNQEDRKAEALKDFIRLEAKCFATNLRVSRIDSCPQGIFDFVRITQSYLKQWMGRAPDSEQLSRSCRHGPGSTFSNQCRNPTIADKYSERPAITEGAIPHLRVLDRTLWDEEIRSKSTFPLDPIEVVNGNRFAVVPKTALKDRTIGVEPSINVYLQLGCGGVLRKRLRPHGIDLDNAAANHRKMAQRASLDGHFATLDLSNASDTVSREVVRLLVEPGWFRLLDDLRSKKTLVGEKWICLEKFSSMGNGYTFELETLIFLALSATVHELTFGVKPSLGRELSVFGDDILCRTECAPLLKQALEFFGFTCNMEKSFVTGPFRESCGGDFFAGNPVRPYYCKDELDDISTLYKAHNGLKRVASLRPALQPVLDRLLLGIPSEYQFWGPDRLGDSCLHTENREWSKYKWEGQVRWIRVLRFTQPVDIGWAPFSDRIRLACSLGGVETHLGLFGRGTVPTLQKIWVSDS